VGDLVTFVVNGFEPHTVSFNSSGAFESGNVIINGQESADPQYLRPYRVTNIAQAVRKLRIQEKRAARKERAIARRQRRKSARLEADGLGAIPNAPTQVVDPELAAQQHALSLEENEFNSYMNDQENANDFENTENELELEADEDLIEEQEDEEELVFEDEEFDAMDAKKNKKRTGNKKNSRRTRRNNRRAAARAKVLARKYDDPYDQGFFGSGLLLPGKTFDIEFARSNPPGTLKPYICFLHQDMGMVGLITIVGGNRK
jgi:plastocyanin